MDVKQLSRRFCSTICSTIKVKNPVNIDVNGVFVVVPPGT